MTTSSREGAGVIHPILLARASELLTDLLSAFLLFIALFQAIPNPFAQDAPRRAALSLLAAGAAAAVRPANLVVSAALLMLWLYRAWIAPFRARDVAAFLIVGSLPLLPQMLINHQFAGTLDPFLMSVDYENQTVWGMRALKYATSPSPGRSPYLVYANPFYDEAWATPGDFLRHSPTLYALTLGIHGFAMLDQDFLFTYITDLRPWYRWPVSLGNYVWLFIVLLGAGMAILRRGPCREDPALRRGALICVAFIGLTLGFYLPTRVESRFGTPVFLLGVPLLAIGLRQCTAISQKRAWRTGLWVGCAGLAFLIACAALSAWIRDHAERSPFSPQSITLSSASPR